MVASTAALRSTILGLAVAWVPRPDASRHPLRSGAGTDAPSATETTLTVIHETIEIERTPEQAFEAVADFSNAEEWDPGVISAERVREGAGAPSGVGARYRLIVSFRGRRSEMTYVTTEYVPPRRVVLEGDGPRITAKDTIEFEATPDGGTRIDYEADLRLRGLAKVAAPLLKGAFDELGREALAGMRSWFASTH